MEEKIAYSGKTKDGVDFVLRYPKPEDLEKLLEFINELSAEETFIRYQGEVITLEQEKEYLDKLLKDINAGKAVELLLFIGDKLAGNAGVVLKTLNQSHVGLFGISLLKEFRGMGLGKLFMEKVIEEAKNKLPGLKTIELSCFINNEAAINLYKRFGFNEFGRLPEGLRRKGQYFEQVFMFKKVT